MTVSDLLEQPCNILVIYIMNVSDLLEQPCNILVIYIMTVSDLLEQPCNILVISWLYSRVYTTSLGLALGYILTV
jgi:uncharacterized membrane protein YhfC